MSLASLFAAEGLEDVPSLTLGLPQTEEEAQQEINEHIIRTGSKPRPWSHSALDNFTNCPHSYHEVKVLKHYPDEKGEAAIWGDRFHTAAEKYLKGEKDLDPELEKYRPYLDGVKSKPGEMHVELEMCLNTSLQPCGAFDKGVFVRGYADVVHITDTFADAIDHKTGKMKPNSRQMKLMALMIFAYFPNVKQVRTSFEWIKFGDRTVERFTRNDIPEMWNEFFPLLKQYRDAFVTDTWQKRQSGLCNGWCPVQSCEFWKPKRIKK